MRRTLVWLAILMAAVVGATSFEATNTGRYLVQTLVSTDYRYGTGTSSVPLAASHVGAAAAIHTHIPSDIIGLPTAGGGYALLVQALTSSPGDGATVYFGALPKAPVTSGGNSRVYIPRAGTIRRAEIWCYSGTAGTSESWSLYVRLNNTSDTLIQTVGSATSARRFTTDQLAIAVSVGDYVEVKGVQPTWATNPATTIYSGYLWIE